MRPFPTRRWRIRSAAFAVATIIAATLAVTTAGSASATPPDPCHAGCTQPSSR